jgi:hypothetical protein
LGKAERREPEPVEGKGKESSASSDVSAEPRLITLPMVDRERIPII